MIKFLLNHLPDYSKYSKSCYNLATVVTVQTLWQIIIDMKFHHTAFCNLIDLLIRQIRWNKSNKNFHINIQDMQPDQKFNDKLSC